MVTQPNKEKTPYIFDTDCARIRNERRARNFQKYDFLFDWSGKHLIERLSDIKRAYDNTAIIGFKQGTDFFQTLQDDDRLENIYAMGDTPALRPENKGVRTALASPEILPFKTDSMDLALCNLNLHGVNDLPGMLAQTQTMLKPDGLFLGSLFGGETLQELRSVLMTAEMEISGGVSPRISPFATKQDMGALMQRTGYALPVIDSEIVTVTYDNAFKLFEDLRGMGESNILQNRSKTMSRRQIFFRAAELYTQHYAEADGRIVATFEIIFLLGWAPHESQQKPLRPGSAQNRLADALKTKEIKTGDKPL